MSSEIVLVNVIEVATLIVRRDAIKKEMDKLVYTPMYWLTEKWKLLIAQYALLIDIIGEAYEG